MNVALHHKGQPFKQCFLIAINLLQFSETDDGHEDVGKDPSTSVDIDELAQWTLSKAGYRDGHFD